jgi:hypothetical protein
MVNFNPQTAPERSLSKLGSPVRVTGAQISRYVLQHPRGQIQVSDNFVLAGVDKRSLMFAAVSLSRLCLPSEPTQNMIVIVANSVGRLSRIGIE